MDKNSYRLPRNVIPLHYDLEIKPDLKNFTFSGHAAVSLDVQEESTLLLLHAAELKIENAKISQGDLSQDIEAIAYDSEKETASLSLKKSLQRGKAQLVLDFEGVLNEHMRGFYRTSYSVNGETHWGGATQFEATDARRAFPCWDEPDLKATFSLTLTVPKTMTALSNMPVRIESREKNVKTIVYEQTPVMSTYLLAFVIAELESVSERDRNGIPIAVWTTPGNKKLGRFALEVALEALPYFSEWFGIPYALPKMDMVALPDFASGAMENWGLITYRENTLLVDPKNSGVKARQGVAIIVTHELAHQWFGNYTTMKWWDGLWLNEGFASYMEYKGVDQQFPQWKMWTKYVSRSILRSFRDDGLKNSHAIEVQVNNPNEISEIFDSISYSKGSVVNRMLNQYLGEEEFQKGLNLYLSRYAFQNATTAQLWEAIEEATQKPVSKMMACYTRQAGYPVIEVQSDKEGSKLLLTQRRFLLNGEGDAEKATWVIPVGWRTSRESSPRYESMEQPTMTLHVAVKNEDWVKLNPDQSGYYRVAYPADFWNRLGKGIEEDALDALDRLGLIDDVFALSSAGYLPTTTTFDFVSHYRNEKDYYVWTAIANGLLSLNNLLEGEEYQTHLHHVGRELFQPIAAELGWRRKAKDDDLNILLRSLALRRLGGFGDPATIKKAQSKFKSFLETEKLEPDLRGMVYSLVAENGSAEEFHTFVRLYEKVTLQEEKLRLLEGMSSFRDEEAVRLTLAFGLSEKVRAQDTPYLIGYMGQNPTARPFLWNYFKEKWEILKDRYYGRPHFPFMIESIVGDFTRPDDLKDASTFFATKRLKGIERTIDKSLERTQANIAWRKRDLENIQSWLSSQ